MIKTLFTTVAIVISHFVWAQKPGYAPFHYQGKTGLTQVDGKEIFSPGKFDNYYLVVDDFKYYILQDSTSTPRRNILLNANTGIEDDLTGHFDAKAGKLRAGNDTYYHFRSDGTSVLFSSLHGVRFLKEDYSRIDPNQQAWANESLQKRQLLWALKTDGGYDVLDATQDFSVVEGLPDFYSYDLIFHSTEDAPMELIGFALGDLKAIDRDIGQMYGITESDKLVDLYDINFKKIGTSAYRAKDISVVFKKNIGLRGGMRPPPETKNRIIVPEGSPVVLNNEFSLIPDPKNVK